MNKIIQGISVFNDRKFFPHCLNLMDVVDKVVIVEGAVKNYPTYAAENSHIDFTIHKQIVEFTQKYKDKVIFFHRSVPWDNMEEMKNLILDCVDEGDWLLITDSDEIHYPNDIAKIRKLIEKHPAIEEFCPIFLYFLSKNVIKMPKPEGLDNPHHQRLVKIKKGMKYLHHPTLTDENGRDTVFDTFYAEKRAIIKDWFVYHYSLARPYIETFLKQYWMFRDPNFCNKDDNESMNLALEHYLHLWENIMLFDGAHPADVDLPIKNIPEELNWKKALAYNLKNREDVKKIIQEGIPTPRLISWGGEEC